MTMGPVEVERKMRQLDDDVQSIYTMLSAIHGTQERHTNRLGELAVRRDSLDTGLDNVETKLGSVDTRLDAVLALLQNPRAQQLRRGASWCRR